MNISRKSYREVQLQKQIEQLKFENEKLKDCILLQRKIIENESKQKYEFIGSKSNFKKEQRKSFLEESAYSKKNKRSKQKSELTEGSNKLLKSLTYKCLFRDDIIESFKQQKLCSTKDESWKTDDQIDESMKKVKQKRKLLTEKDLKELNLSYSSTNLYRPTQTDHTRRKSYIQKLAEQLAND